VSQPRASLESLELPPKQACYRIAKATQVGWEKKASPFFFLSLYSENPNLFLSLSTYDTRSKELLLRGQVFPGLADGIHALPIYSGAAAVSRSAHAELRSKYVENTIYSLTKEGGEKRGEILSALVAGQQRRLYSYLLVGDCDLTIKLVLIGKPNRCGFL
jgi:hypothetical protein